MGTKTESFPRGNELNLHFFSARNTPTSSGNKRTKRMLFCLSRSSLFSSSLRSPSSVRSRKASVKSTTVRNTASLDETSSTSTQTQTQTDRHAHTHTHTQSHSHTHTHAGQSDV